MLLHFGPPGTPEEPGGHRHTRCVCRLLLRALLCPLSLSEPPVPSVRPVWSESEQKRWTQPPWRPADWVQIPAPARQSVAFRNLGESSDKRADDHMQGGSPSVLAERASALEADVLSDCWPASVSYVILAEDLCRRVFISTGSKYLGEGRCAWRTSHCAQPRVRAQQMVARIVRPLQKSRGLSLATWRLSVVFLFLRVKVSVAQSCLTLCDPLHCRPPGSSSRQGYWSRLPFASPGDLPSSGIRPGSLWTSREALLFLKHFPSFCVVSLCNIRKNITKWQ